MPRVAAADLEPGGDGEVGGQTNCGSLRPRALLHISIALMGPFVAAMSLGFTSPALSTMQGTVKGVDVPVEFAIFAQDAWLATWFSSLVNIGALLGAAVGGWVGDFAGRYPALRLAAVMMGAGWAWIAFVNSAFQVCCARVLIGLGVGLQSVVAPRLIAEASPRRIRGALGTLNAGAILVGAMFVQALGGSVFRAGPGHALCDWRGLASFVAIVAGSHLLGSLSLLYVPLRECATTGAVVDPNVLIAPASSSGETALVGQLREHWKLVVAGVVPMVWQQLSGINAVIFFGQSLLQQAGVESYDILGVTVLAIQCAGVLLAFMLVERLGRRPLLIASTFGMAVGALALSFSLKIHSPFLALMSIYVYVLSFAIGLGPVPWLLLPELCLPSGLRSTVASLATAANWGCSFAVTGPPLNAVQRACGLEGVFLLLGSMCLIGGVLVVALVPETKPPAPGLRRRFSITDWRLGSESLFGAIRRWSSRGGEDIGFREGTVVVEDAQTAVQWSVQDKREPLQRSQTT